MPPSRSYEILDRVGAGGMAEVFRARLLPADGAPSLVVIKQILPHLSNDQTYVRMLFDEARIASSLDSPNIVKLLDFGRMNGRLFIAFELVEGSDLRRLAKSAAGLGGVPIPIAIHLARRLLDGLHYAHTKSDSAGKPMGIVHRDVSPGNVLVSRYGEVKLADFGVAKAASRSTQTVAGVVKGNLHFMAPEQLGGIDVDARADVYGAGMLLYVLLAGRHPFQDDPISLVISRALRGDIPPPSTLNPRIVPRLEDVVLRATRLWPGFRYQSAAEFSEALADVTTVAELPTADTADVAAWLKGLLGPEPAVPRIPLTRVVKIMAATDVSEYRVVVNAATETETTTEKSAVPTDLVRGTVTATPTTTTEKSVFANPAEKPSITEGRVVEPSITASAGTDVEDVPTSKTQAPKIDAAPGWLTGHRGAVSAVAIDLESGLLASAGTDKTARIWSLRLKKEMICLPAHEGAVTSIAFCGTDQLLTGGRDKTLRLWDLASRRLLHVLEGHQGWIFGLAISPDGLLAASASSDRTVRVWDLSAAKPPRVLEGHRDAVTSVAFASRNRVISGSYDRTLRVWDLTDGSERVLTGESDSVRALAVSKDGALALSGGADSLIRTWDLALGSESHYLFGHEEPVVALAISPDKRFALSGSYDRSVRLWDLARREEIRTFVGHSDPVLSVAFGPGVLVSGGADGKIGIWTPPL